MSRVKYLDGLRGLACLIVVLDHFLYSFYPSSLLGNPSTIHNSFELVMAKSPLNVFYNGNFAVCIFFVLSGLVLSTPFFTSKDRYAFLNSAAIRRYPRLVIPMIVSGLLAYILIKVGWTYNQSAAQITKSDFLGGFYLFNASILDSLKQSVYSIIFEGANPTYVPVLWTMKIEFFGSLLVFAILALTGNVKKRFIVYSLLSIVLYKSYYISFLFGLMLSDLLHHRSIVLEFIRKKYIKYPLLIIAIYIGSFPIVGLPNFPGSKYYDFMIIKSLESNGYVFYHNVGAALLLMFVLTSTYTQKILSKPVFQWLGKVSFPIYLIHLPIICSFSSLFFIKLVNYMKFDIAFIITVICSFIIICILSSIMNRYVDNTSIKWAKSISKLLLNDKKHK